MAVIALTWTLVLRASTVLSMNVTETYVNVIHRTTAPPAQAKE